MYLRRTFVCYQLSVNPPFAHYLKRLWRFGVGRFPAMGSLWETIKGGQCQILWSDFLFVVFTMSVGFGGQLIGYVTTGRALICFLPPAHRCSTHLLLTADPSCSSLNVCPSSDTLFIGSGSVEVQVGEWWRKIRRQNSWIEKLFAAADKPSMLLHFDK